MASSWKRPESVPFPSIWSRFEGKREINGKIPKFWIQDIPEELFDEAAEIMCKNFIYDEPLCKFSKLAEDELSKIEMRELWKRFVREKVGLICFMENPDPAGKPIIAGLNMTYPSDEGKPVPKFRGKAFANVFDVVLHLYKKTDYCSMLGIDKYLSAFGLSVLPEFRGQGIGDELLKARIPLCKAVGFPATLTVFSSVPSQKLAVRCGFKDIISMTYEELEEIDPRFKFPGILEHTKNIRFMYKMVE